MSITTKAVAKVAKLKKDKIALIALGSIIAGGAVFGIVKGVRYYKSTKAEQDAKERNGEIQQQAQKKVMDRKMSDADASVKAKDLLDAMDGMGTDEEVIKRVLLDENPSVTDLQAIVNAFGTQDYGTFGKPLWGNGEKLNLMEWLKKEVDNTSYLYGQLKVKFETCGYAF